MAATLKVTHKALGAEVRRNPEVDDDVVIDSEQIGSVKMNGTIELSVGWPTERLSPSSARERFLPIFSPSSSPGWR